MTKIRTATCIDCRVEFSWATKGPTRQRCDECGRIRRREVVRAKAARWRAANPERNREHQNRANRKRLADPEHLRWKREDAMRRAYGITPQEYEALSAGQGGVCAICGNGHVGPGKRLHVDHCHDTTRIRGLLCSKCNTAIGLMNDSPELAESVAAYLRR